MLDWIRRQLDHIRATPHWLQDLLLAIAISQADLVAVVFTDRDPGLFGVASRPVAAIAALLIALPLVFRRNNPDLTMMLTGAGAGIAGVFGIPVQPLAPLVALYTVAAYGSLQNTVGSTVIFLAIITGLYATGGELPLLYTNILIVLGAAVTGRIVRAYRDQTVELLQRAAELQRSREERAQFAVRSERTRISREMHDVLAHSISVMVVQATGARRLLPGKPDQAAQALTVVEDTGRQSLAEMRRMLGLLRDEGEGAPSGPQPGLDDIRPLVEEFARSGLPVDLRTRGEAPANVDPSVGLSAYRILQEALTNCLRHARATRVTVDLRSTPGRLDLEVLDNGSQVPSPGPHATQLADVGGGFGLIGMRERAALVGATLEVGARPGVGYRVAASFSLSLPSQAPSKADRASQQLTEPAGPSPNRTVDAAS